MSDGPGWEVVETLTASGWVFPGEMNPLEGGATPVKAEDDW